MRRIENIGLGVEAGAVAVTVAVALGLSAIVGAITDANYGSKEAEQYVERSGYTDVDLTDTSIFAVGFKGCDKGDTVKYSFEATAPNGTNSEVIVCKGLFKGGTLRDDG